MLAISKHSIFLLSLFICGCSHLNISGDPNLQEERNTFYKASYKKGKLNGNWQSWYPSGNLCDSGRFEKNLPTGIWKFWDSEGRLTHIRQYSADKYERIKGEFTRHNPKQVSYSLTDMYNKNRKVALQYLHSSYSFPLRSVTNETMPLQDVVERNVLSGNSYNPVFKQCLHDGLYVNYASSGVAIDSGYYKDGLKDGLWIHTEASGQKKYQGTYVKGLRTKEWKVYNSQNRLLETQFYDDKGNLSWSKQIKY